ncbi:MAG: MFS transporter [Burkholderiaceae bacterium]
MINSLRSAAFDRLSPKFFYGWVILAVTSLAIFSSGPGQSHTFSVFVDPITRDLGLSKQAISIAYGLATLVAALLLPRMGKLVDIYGPQRMTFWVAAALGLACILFGAVGGPITLALGFGALRFLGQGSLMLNCANLVAQWFNAKRGFAMSLMALGFGISMAVHPPLGQYLIGELGWRWAWLVLGLLTWVILLPPVLLLIHNKPEPLGLRPDGEAALKEGEQAEDIDGLTPEAGKKVAAFYIISAGWFFISMLVTTLHFHQVGILGAQGLDEATAARLFSVSAIAMVLTMPLVGKLLDSVRTRFVFAACMLILSTALFGITLVESFESAIVYAVVFGLTNSFTMTMFGYLMPRYFGRKHLGVLQGQMQLIAVIGASIGPWPVGWAFDFFGDPTMTLRWLAVLPVMTAVLAALMLKTPAGVRFPAHLE